MALNTEFYEEEWSLDDWYEPIDEFGYYDNQHAAPPIDVITIAAVILVILVLIFAIKEILWRSNAPIVIQTPTTIQENQIDEHADVIDAPLINSSDTFAAPYDNYTITQGIHGQSYGHMAIDIAAGKGEPIKSPIVGIVTDYFIDGIGNPTLVIENDLYRITMLHGNYTVAVGQELELGAVVGTEGNLGNTRDMQGRSCRGRDCGYHTHLNVFDKQLGMNVNPLELFEG